MSPPVQNDAELDANRAYLVAEFDRLKRRLARAADPAGSTEILEESRRHLPSPAPIDIVAHVFGLSRFERDLLLLSAGVEMDRELARSCAEAQGGTGYPVASFALGLAALDQPHWSALAPIGALRQWRMIRIDEGPGLTTAPLRIDERILHYIAGINHLDSRLEPLLRSVGVPGEVAQEHRQVSRSLLEGLGTGPSRPRIILLTGDDPDGQQDVAAEVAAGLQMQLFSVSAGDLPSLAADIDEFRILWEREAALTASVLLLECRDTNASRPVIELARRIGTTLFISSPSPLPVQAGAMRFTIDKPAADEQKRLWERALGGASAELNGSLDSVSAQFRLSARTILAAGAALRADLGGADRPDALLWGACRSASRDRLDDLAERLNPTAQWDDLVLPDPQKAILRRISGQARHRLTVYRNWGFDASDGRGLGINALFAGESGTGKTMAAEVLANDLQLDIYRIDLSAVVSKYIGETEKNLGRVFDAAEDNGAILLFDEADALFGKRSEVHDSHDRYANIEVSYLLQRMEAYRGLAILTTNAKSALDTAFERRLRFIVQFPFPDQPEREAIWRRVFPALAPLDGIDPVKLSRLNMSGGNIRNIALNAAFLAAESGPAITMRHLLDAAHGEAAKRNRAISESETRGWV